MPQTLKQSVEEALKAYSALRNSRPDITVTVDDGVVTLSGYVSSTSIREMATVLAGSVGNVSEVVNELHADPKLERSVALALAQDERTRPLPIRVRSTAGYVQLQGQVPDEAAAKAAMEVARTVKGPKQVVSALKVRQPIALST
jgi:osmotically-inducible protein OsmY